MGIGVALSIAVSLAHNRVSNDVAAYIKLITIEKTKVRSVTILASSGLDPPQQTITGLDALLNNASPTSGTPTLAALTAVKNQHAWPSRSPPSSRSRAGSPGPSGSSRTPRPARTYPIRRVSGDVYQVLPTGLAAEELDDAIVDSDGVDYDAEP